VGGIQLFLDLLSAGPGSLVYHLLILLALEAAVGIAFTEYHRTRNPDQRRLLWVFAALVVLRIPLLVGRLWGNAPLSPLLYALEVASLALMGWAFLAPLIGRRLTWFFLVGNLVAAAGLALIFLPSWHQMLQVAPAFEYTAFWQQPVWDLWATLLALAATVLHGAYRRRLGYSLPAVSFALITVGNGLILFDQVGIGRLVNLVGYPLLAVSVYRAALQDLWAYRSELEALSEGALRQTRELLFLLDVGRALGESFDLSSILSRVAESIAHALDADRVAILLRDEEPDRLLVAAQYALLQRQREAPAPTVSVAGHPLLAHVMHRRKPLLINPQVRPSRLRTLYELLGARGEGPLILQPLLREQRVLGVLVVGNDRSQRPFGVKEARLCDAVAPQIAAAVENVRLYRRLDRQARELAAALEVQEREGRWLEAVLESIAEGIVVADSKGRAVRVNAAAEEILGVGRDRILGRPLAQVLESASGRQIDWQQLQESVAPLHMLFQLQGKQVQIHATPIRSPHEGVMGAVAVLRDITREVQAERAKRGFIATISHELRTPLTAILGYAEVLYTQTAGRLTETQARFVRIIHNNARRMIAIANNLIALAESERGRLELQYAETDLALILGEVLDSFIPRMRARELEWRLEIEDDLPTIEADPARIRQVVSNLVSNAVKYTFPGGKIEVGAAIVREEGMDEPEYCRIWVRDTGIGIPPEEQGRIWQRFYRPRDPLRMEAGGLGVGLSVVKSLTEAHGGRVWVDSSPGRGSTFTVLLPIHRPAPSLLEVEPEYPDLEEATGVQGG